jgi:type II secretory pathway pseudopilin PulG
MLVSIALFLVILSIAMGSLVTLVDAGRKARAVRASIDNLTHALEEMTREVREGKRYHCDHTDLTVPIDEFQECFATGTSSLAFEPSRGSATSSTDQYVYWLDSSTNRIMRSADSGTSWTAITEPNITIDRLLFYVNSPETEWLVDEQHPHVLVVVGGRFTERGESSEFSLQMTVTQRTRED